MVEIKESLHFDRCPDEFSWKSRSTTMPCTLTMATLFDSLVLVGLPSAVSSSVAARPTSAKLPQCIGLRLCDSWQPLLPKSPHTPCSLCARLRIPSSMVSFLLLSARSCGRRIRTWEWSMCSKKKLRWLCGEKERVELQRRWRGEEEGFENFEP